MSLFVVVEGGGKGRGGGAYLWYFTVIFVYPSYSVTNTNNYLFGLPQPLQERYIYMGQFPRK